MDSMLGAGGVTSSTGFGERRLDERNAGDEGDTTQQQQQPLAAANVLLLIPSCSAGVLPHPPRQQQQQQPDLNSRQQRNSLGKNG